MYSLLMVGIDGYWDDGPGTMEISRFLEYTVDELKPRFAGMTDAVIAELKAIPALFCYEFPTEHSARVGWITGVQRRQKEYRVIFDFDPSVPAISPDVFDKLQRHLDIGKFEIHRTHWAIKEVDLFEVLRDNGVISHTPAPIMPGFRFSRQTVLKACDLLKLRLGHSGFDRMLKEIGLPHIKAGRDQGGLAARAVALSSYAVDHMDELTAEKEPLAAVVVRFAAQLDPHYSDDEDIQDPTRTGFWESFKRDGYHLVDGQLRNSITGVNRSIAALQVSSSLKESRAMATPSKQSKVFIVHGRDSAAKLEVGYFLRKIGIEDVILHERPNGGRTIIAKFQEESADVEFAVVIMTPDDVGGLKDGDMKARARQNVIFELGFFIGKLGAEKVCALVQGDVEKPSDFDAVVYISMGSNGTWRSELARELHHAGVQFDPTKAL